MVSSSLSMAERKESASDEVSRGEEGVEDWERVESEAGEANWTMVRDSSLGLGPLGGSFSAVRATATPQISGCLRHRRLSEGNRR